MSDDNKPHDDHAHDDAGHAAGHDPAHDDPGHAAGHEHETPAPAVHDQPSDAPASGTVADAQGEPVHAVIHEEHPAAGDPAPADDVHPVADAHAAGHGHDPAPAEGNVDPHPGADAPGDHAAVAAGAAAGAAAASSRPPVWSDSGDAPFEDVDHTPVYARGGKKGRRKGRSGGGNEAFEIVKTIFFALLIAFVLRVLLFQPFTIPSASMEPNLYEGDYIVVSKWSYGYSKHAIPFSPPVFEGRIFAREPERGDIVVFKLPRDNRTDYIKRVIGLPGDRVQMVDNVLHINGEPVRDVVISDRDATNMYGMPIIQARETLPNGRTFTIQDYGPGNDADDTPVFEVPEGYYFMMGDNRDNSIDSRFEMSSGGVGLVPAENLIGKAEIILFSWREGASLWNPVSWFSKVRPSRFFTVLH